MTFTKRNGEEKNVLCCRRCRCCCSHWCVSLRCSPQGEPGTLGLSGLPGLPGEDGGPGQKVVQMSHNCSDEQHIQCQGKKKNELKRNKDEKNENKIFIEQERKTNNYINNIYIL